MNIHTILGALSFLLGIILLMPFMRRRAAERGMSGISAVPLGYVIIGFIVFLTGLWFHASPP